MPKTHTAINLLPQEEFDASIIGRILKWAMGTFRIIVIVTEMVVMAAFLSRFWLDAQNSDLSDSIKIRVAQISAQNDFEKEFRGIQSKLAIFKSLSSVTPPSDRLDSVATKIPPDVTLSSVSILEGSLAIKGIAQSELGVLQFVSNLQSDKSFKKVEVAGVNTAEDNPNQIVFNLTISY